MALVEEELPGVSKVRSEFQVREDEGLAHKLQEQEFEEHFNSNVQLRRTARHDVKFAQEAQREEVQAFRLKESQRQQSLREREEEDRQQAEKVAQKLKEEEDIQMALKMQDELMAKKLHEEEMKRIAMRQQQEQADLRLARQTSLKEDNAILERRRREQELSESEIQRLKQLELQRRGGGGTQPQRSKYPSRDPGMSLPAQLQSPVREQQRSKYISRDPRGSPAQSPIREQQSLRHPQQPAPIPQSSQAPLPPAYHQVVTTIDGDEPPVMDENERIALQEEEDERLARELQEREEASRDLERQRREQKDMEMARKLQEEERKRKSAAQELQKREQEDLDLAKRLHEEEIQAARRQSQRQPHPQQLQQPHPQQQRSQPQQPHPQQQRFQPQQPHPQQQRSQPQQPHPQQQRSQPQQPHPQQQRSQPQQPHPQQQRSQPQQPHPQQPHPQQPHPQQQRSHPATLPGPPPPNVSQSLPPGRQYRHQSSLEERQSPNHTVAAPLVSPTQSAPASLGQLPPEGHPFNPTVVSTYHPGMTGVQVTRVPQATYSQQHAQARPSYKRTDTKKGKKK